MKFISASPTWQLWRLWVLRKKRLVFMLCCCWGMQKKIKNLSHLVKCTLENQVFQSFEIIVTSIVYIIVTCVFLYSIFLTRICWMCIFLVFFLRFVFKRNIIYCCVYSQCNCIVFLSLLLLLSILLRISRCHDVSAFFHLFLVKMLLMFFFVVTEISSS